MDFKHFLYSKWHKTKVKCDRCGNEILREIKFDGELTNHFCCSNSSCSYLSHDHNIKKIREQIPPEKCATKVNHNGCSCPEKGTYMVAVGIYFCEKCIVNYRRSERKILEELMSELSEDEFKKGCLVVFPTEKAFKEPIYMPSFSDIKKQILPKEIISVFLELEEKRIQYYVGRKTKY